MSFDLRRLAKAISVAALCAAVPSFALAAGDVTFIQAVEPTGLDPSQDSPVAAGQVTWQNVFEGLVTIDRNAQVQPQLAESWDISDDGLVYTFHLRDGVTYHNGAAFDASVAKFSFEKLIGEASTNGQKALYSAIASIEAPDAATLVFTLSTPSSDLLYWLGFPAAVIVEPSSAETNATAPVGTGPFKLDEWRKGDRVIMSAYDGYWGGRAELDTVTARFISDPQAQIAALKSGQAQVMAELSAPELFGEFTADDRFVAHVGNGEMEVIAGMNGTKAPFDNPKVRQALMKSIDRQALIDAVTSGYATPIGSHFSPASPYYEDLTGEYAYDPAAAKALLAEAGYPNGFTFNFTVPTRPYAQRSAEIMQAFFQQIGVTANIQSAEFPATWVQQVFTDNTYEMTVIGHAEPLDINIYARHPYYMNYENPEFDGVMAEVAAATTPEAREAGYRKAQEIIARDLPALFLYSNAKLGIWDAKLEGVWENGPVPSNDMTEVHWTE